MSRFSTQYDRKVGNVKTSFTKPTAVVKSLRDLCNLNDIMEKYSKGEKPNTVRDLKYGDTTVDVDGYVAAKNLLECVNLQYQTLPANVRRNFKNCADFVNKFNTNPELMRDLGIITKKEYNEKYVTAPTTSSATADATASAGTETTAETVVSASTTE